MSELKKTISINPDLFSFTSTAGTRKKKPKNSGEAKEKPPSRKKREDSLKKRSILKMIRQRQEDMYKSLFDKSSTQKAVIEETPLNKEFKEAELFFQNLTERKEEEKKKNATIKHYPAQPKSLLFHPSISNITPVNIDLPTELSIGPVSIKPRPASNMPLHGCLKNGTLPTYRDYMNRTRKMLPSTSPTPTLLSNPMSGSVSSPSSHHIGGASSKETVMNDKINESLKRISEIKQTETRLNQLNRIKAPTVKKQRRIRTRTYKVGKSKVLPRVSVLVSNKTLRNRVSTQSQLLKQVPIQDVKKYLMKRGLIKVGSTAPQDVLRKMYESSVMICGEIQNHNPDNLLYNFIYGAGEH
jgi:hypothetical protein